MTHIFHPSIIREYDIRGVVNETLFEKDAYELGRGFAHWVGAGRKMAVACDGRVSSPELKAALIEGLRAGGVHVTDVGMGPTPMLYFAVKTLENMAAGIMVTGSHNPPTHNGFKMMRAEGSVYGQQIKDLAARIADASYTAQPTGGLTIHDMQGQYTRYIVERGVPSLNADYTIVWDCGNGATGAVIDDVIARLPGTHHVLFKDVDGTFPNHDPDPTKEQNMTDLKAAVRAHGAALGLGFDGDGDRVGLVDDTGRFVPMDDLIALLAQDVLKDHPGVPIIADVKCGPQLFEYIAQAGGEPVMWRTGHSPIKAKMVETGAPFAGEFSGHLFFADRYFGFDDGLYAGLRVLDILAKTGRNLSELLAPIPARIGLPELRLVADDAEKFTIVENFARQVQNHPDFPKNGKIITIDGIRVEMDDGWMLLRASNTEGALVLRVEAKDQGALARLQAMVRDVFAQLSLPQIADKIAA